MILPCPIDQLSYRYNNMIFRGNTSVREQPYIVEPISEMKSKEMLSISSSVGAKSTGTPQVSSKSSPFHVENQLRVPTSTRNIIKGGSRLKEIIRIS